MDQPTSSIIITVMNEEDTIEEVARRVLAVLEDCEVLVVDGGSDRTGEIVQALSREDPRFRYIRNENDRGKGHAVRKGIEAARADVMAQIDADLQFLPEELPGLLEPVLSGQADVSLGSRFMYSSTRKRRSVPGFRPMGNRITSIYASILCRHWMTDILSGMKAWSREAIDTIQIRFDHASYDAELPVRAVRLGLRVVDVPVTTDPRIAGVSKIKVLSVGPRLWRDITLIFLGLK